MRLNIKGYKTVQGTDVTDLQLLELLSNLLTQAKGQSIDDDEVILHLRRAVRDAQPDEQ